MKLYKKATKNILKLKPIGSNSTYEQIMKTETKRFKEILERKINDYFNSYTPVVYSRGKHGGDLRHSLSIDEICYISSSGNTITCNIIINENAIHQSIVTGDLSNAFWLMDNGWRVKKDVWFRDKYMFGFFEGANYVNKAIEEFNSNNKYNIRIHVNRPLIWY